jgi:hypothetical protein
MLMNFCSERIGTVRKSNMFAEEMTETEIDIIQQRVALQQKQVRLTVYLQPNCNR